MKYKVKETTKANGDKYYTVYSKNDWEDFKYADLHIKIAGILFFPLLICTFSFYGEEESYVTLQQAIDYINKEKEKQLKTIQQIKNKKIISQKIVYTQN